MLRGEGLNVIIYEPTLKKNEFEKFTVISDLEEFKKKSDVILANRMEECLKDIQEKITKENKQFSRFIIKYGKSI